MSAIDLHKKAEDARENDSHLDALKFIEDAIVEYQKEKDYPGLCEILQSKVLTYKHFFLITKDKVFAILAKNTAKTSFEIAMEYGLSEKLGSCYFRLGEIEMLFKNFQNAIKNYQKALQNYSGTNAQKGDYTYHLGEALYRSGEKDKGLETILQGLKLIEQNLSDVDPFLAHVWQSGCYLTLFDLLRNSQPYKAKDYLKKAEEIISSDEKLVIRKRQLRQLQSKFNS